MCWYNQDHAIVTPQGTGIEDRGSLQYALVVVSHCTIPDSTYDTIGHIGNSYAY